MAKKIKPKNIEITQKGKLMSISEKTSEKGKKGEKEVVKERIVTIKTKNKKVVIDVKITAPINMHPCKDWEEGMFGESEEDIKISLVLPTSKQRKIDGY